MEPTPIFPYVTDDARYVQRTRTEAVLQLFTRSLNSPFLPTYGRPAHLLFLKVEIGMSSNHDTNILENHCKAISVKVPSKSSVCSFSFKKYNARKNCSSQLFKGTTTSIQSIHVSRVDPGPRSIRKWIRWKYFENSSKCMKDSYVIDVVTCWLQYLIRPFFIIYIFYEESIRSQAQLISLLKCVTQNR